MTEGTRPNDWTTEFITPAWDEDVTESQLARTCDASSTSWANCLPARLYITALGVYQAEINGHRVSEDVLRPGLDELPAPSLLPDLRRHRDGAIRSERDRRYPCRRLGHGQPRPSLIAPLFSHSAQRHLQ